MCRPKKHGGLGVLNLEIQNCALLLKQLHKFFCKADVPWVKLVWSIYGDSPPHAQSSRGSFWWRDIFKLVNIYRSITKSEVHNGKLTLFWKDFWYGNELLCDRFPHLYSYVFNEDSSVAELAANQHPGQLFALPLSIEAFREHEQIRLILASVDHQTTTEDTHTFPWGNGHYTLARYYKFIFAQMPQNTTLQSIWNPNASPSLKCFYGYCYWIDSILKT